ncbi:hypothetical protein GF359_06640, partial [candidate division WOR-3 bacterium]|nr:hypothetical protein [candidate division WOR-3 bacterium]MBD3364876.1 hypothetical protein [candidate division WOR-3 bacterium]
GTNYEIGKKLAELAIEGYGFGKNTAAATSPSVNRALREYFFTHYKIHLDRSRGVAAALGIDSQDDRFDFGTIPFNMGCSSVFYPGSVSQTGQPVLSRNFDFPLFRMPEMMGIELSEDENKLIRPLMAHPYILELYPSDGGYPSIGLHSFDLLSGVLDGINSKGLMVAVHGNEIAMRDQTYTPQPEGIGLFELQSVRLLLDTCSNTDEAKKTLLSNRHYFLMLPCIYLVADREGNSFVFEPGLDGGEARITEGAETPLILTNHSLDEYPNPDSFPKKKSFTEAGTSTFDRYETLRDRIEGKSPPYSVEDMKEINSSVGVSSVIARVTEEKRKELVSSPGLARTLWHALYAGQSHNLDIKFYLEDESDDRDGFTEKYSEYHSFTLK